MWGWLVLPIPLFFIFHNHSRFAWSNAEFATERSLLSRRVFPEVRSFCAALGYEFEVVDVTGCKEEIPELEQRLRILQEAQRSSLGPFYLVR